uniref:Uncharacterized protein n=1 Tax=Glossina pallidipes TaxID=7398 RepID=A0A1B0ADJ5_GLOPL
MCNRKETEIEVKICTSKSIKNEEQESASAAVVVAASAAVVVVTSALAFVSLTNNAMFVSIWECQVHKTAAAIAVPVAVDPFHCFHRHTLDYLFAILITVQVTSYELVSNSGGGDSDVFGLLDRVIKCCLLFSIEHLKNVHLFTNRTVRTSVLIAIGISALRVITLGALR